MQLKLPKKKPNKKSTLTDYPLMQKKAFDGLSHTFSKPKKKKIPEKLWKTIHAYAFILLTCHY